MDRLKGWFKQIVAAVRPATAEREMQDELAFHLEQETEQNRRRGLTPTDARRAALLAFGATESVKESLRGAGVRGIAAEAARALRHAVRAIRRRPSFALAVIATLGLGIGVSSAMYSVVDAVVVRPLPYPGGDRLLAVWETYPGWRGRPVLGDMWDRIGLAWPDYEQWRAGQTTFEDVAVFAGMPRTVSGGAPPEVIRAGRVSGSLWRLLGVSPLAGRLFTDAEAGPGADPIAVLSHGLWQRRFGGDRRAVGQSLLLNDRTFVVVGVLPAGFTFGGERGQTVDVWIPAGAAGMPLGEDNHSFAAFGRLHPDATIEAATAEAARLFLGDRRPGSRGASLQPYREQVVGTSRQPLLLLLAGTLVLLLIGCVNVAALMAGDAARRDREVATRRMLGASRGRILCQFVAEALALSLAAGVLGLAIAAVGIPALVALAPSDLPRLQEAGLSPAVVAFTLVAALVTTLVCAAASVVVIERRRQPGVAGSGVRVVSGGRRLQPLFVGIQLAMLTVLVTAGALLGRSLLAVQAVDPGFATSNLLTAVVNLPGSRFQTRGELVAFYRRLTEAVAAIPGVDAVSGVSIAPFADGSESTSVSVEGLPDTAAKPEMERRVVLPGFFGLMQVPVLDGTAALDNDARVVAVSESMAARLWPGQRAVGRRVSLRDEWYTVEAVVADVRDQALDRAPRGTYYVSQQAARDSAFRMRLLARTSVDPAIATSDVRRAIAGVDATVPIGEIASLESMMSRSLAAERYRALLVNLFAGASLLLAAVGIFGVTLRLLLRRQRELGVRLALGARPLRLFAEAIAGTMAGAAAGLAVGTMLAALLMPALSDYLYELPARDAATYAVTAALLLAVSLGAAAVPTIGATRLNIVEVLREE